MSVAVTVCAPCGRSFHYGRMLAIHRPRARLAKYDRCLSDDEMRALGWTQGSWRSWTAPYAVVRRQAGPKQRRRPQYPPKRKSAAWRPPTRSGRISPD